MQLRRFTADTTPAALGAVRMAFGDDALILANRRIGDQVEIIATSSAEDVSVLEQFMAQEEQDAALRTKYATNGKRAPKDKIVASAAKGSVTVLEEDYSPSPIQPDSVPDAVMVDTVSVSDLARQAVDGNNEQFSSISELSKDINSIAIDEPALRLQGSDELEPDTVELSASRQDKTSTEVAGGGKTLEQVNEDAMQAASAAINVNLTESTPQAFDPTSITEAVTSAVQGIVESAVQDAVQKALMSTNNESMKVLSEMCEAMNAQRQSVESRFKSLEVNLWGDQAPERSQHLRKVFALGIGAELAVRLVERIEPETPVEDALRRSLALLKSTLPIGSDKSLTEPGVTVFSGPAGGGKTTALFKLATQHVKKFGNQSIVIIGADTRRIGAFEEIQAYGKLLGVPTVQASDTSEFERMLAAFAHKQLVLVDRGLPENGTGIEIPESNSSACGGVAVRELFVLPANMQAITVDALITEHCSNRKVQCVLTHLDSSARLGELFNSIIRHHLPVAYSSDNQSVQIPLEKADASVLVATAVAMGQRITASADDEWLQRLIQPSRQLLSDAVLQDEKVRGAQS